MRLVLFALAVFLSSWSLVVEAANIPVRSGSAGRTSWNVQTSNLDSVIEATNASVQIGRDIIANIGYGGKQIGSVAAMEVSAIGIADMAAVVARASGPVMIAMMAGDLAIRGLQRCMESGTGWCKRAPVNANQGDSGFNGYQYCFAGGAGVQACGDSPDAACAAVIRGAGLNYVGLHPSDSPTYYWCKYRLPDGTLFDGSSAVSQQATCVKGYTVQGGQCKPDPQAPENWLPASYPDVAAAWNAQMAANPNRIPDYWKQMSPDEQASAQQSAKRQPTQMKGTDTVSDPNVSTSTETSTKADGTQQQCTTTTGVRVQARPNSGPSAASSPLNYQTTSTTTRTCPDGTTTTVENSDSGDTQPRGGGGSRPEVKMCGLADTGPCKIDETGTPTYKEPSIAKDKMDDADNRLKTKIDSIGESKPDQFGIGDVVKPLQGACSSFSYAFPKATGIESMDIDFCPTIEATRDVVTWLWIIVSAMVCVLLVRDAINGA